MSERTLRSFIARSAGCERRFGEFYAELARKCRKYPAAAHFWKAFADDEAKHAELIGDIGHSLAEEHLSAPATRQQWSSLLTAERLLASGLIEQVRDLNDAYELTHEIETHELIPVFQIIRHHALPDAKREAMIKAQIDDHIERLDRLKSILGDVESRKAARLTGT